MGKKLHILILEDVPADASLMERELRKAGVAFITRCVETEEDFVKGIQEFKPDLILADYTLPSFDGLSALAIAREQCPEVPFIFVTGSLNEETGGGVHEVRSNRLCTEGSSRPYRPCGQGGIGEEYKPEEEQERAEEVLRVSDIRYRRLFESAKDGILVLDGDTTEITDVNPYMVEMLGYNYDELLGKKICDVSPFKETEKTQTLFRELQKEGYIRYENLLLETKEKKPIDVEFVSNAYDVDGKKVIQCNLRDITGRKRAEEALRKSETKFQELFNDAPVGYFEYDQQGCITSVNRTEMEMLGYTLEEMIGQPAWKFIVEEDEARHQMLAKLAGIMPPAHGIERTYRRKDGTTFPALIWNRLLNDSEGKIIGIRSTIQNITERKQMEKEKALLEEQLRQSQKMEAMGRLAGGIAHDFNNLLTIIKGYSQLFLIDLKKGDPMEQRH